MLCCFLAEPSCALFSVSWGLLSFNILRIISSVKTSLRLWERINCLLLYTPTHLMQTRFFYSTHHTVMICLCGYLLHTEAGLGLGCKTYFSGNIYLVYYYKYVPGTLLRHWGFSSEQQLKVLTSSCSYSRGKVRWWTQKWLLLTLLIIANALIVFMCRHCNESVYIH